MGKKYAVNMLFGMWFGRLKSILAECSTVFTLYRLLTIEHRALSIEHWTYVYCYNEMNIYDLFYAHNIKTAAGVMRDHLHLFFSNGPLSKMSIFHIDYYGIWRLRFQHFRSHVNYEFFASFLSFLLLISMDSGIEEEKKKKWTTEKRI